MCYLPRYLHLPRAMFFKFSWTFSYSKNFEFPSSLGRFHFRIALNLLKKCPFLFIPNAWPLFLKYALYGTAKGKLRVGFKWLQPSLTYTHEEFYVDDLDFAETFSALLISTKENYLTITEKAVFTKNTDWCKSVAYFRSLALFCGRCYFRKLPFSKFFNLC